MNESANPIPEPRTVDPGRGVEWWSQAWALFVKNPGIWVALGLVQLIIFIVLSFIPVLGAVANALLATVFAGGWMLAVRKAESGGTVQIGDLFACFQRKPTPLLVVGALLFVGMLVVMLIAGALGFGAVMGVARGGGHQGVGGVMAAMSAGLLSLLIALALGALVAMAVWFAPALVVFRDVQPVDAVRASFGACLKNLVPFLVYGVIYLVAAIVASIPFGLGWIVLLPLTVITVYLSYKDLFESQDAAAPLSAPPPPDAGP